MKYILLFCSTAAEEKEWETLPDGERNRRYGLIGQWFETNRSTYVSGEELQPVHTATTIRFDPKRQAVVTDGPFMEAKEVIGGYAVIDVADLDEALRLAKTWPGGSGIEIRPVVPH